MSLNLPIRQTFHREFLKDSKKLDWKQKKEKSIPGGCSQARFRNMKGEKVGLTHLPLAQLPSPKISLLIINYCPAINLQKQ